MKNFRTCLRGIHVLSIPVRGRAAVSVVLGLVRVAASMFFVWVSKALVDIACGHLDKPLPVFITLMIVIMLVQLACNVAFAWWEGRNSVKTQIQMREKLFSHVMRSVWNGRERFHSADTVNRLEDDIRVVVDLLCSRFPDAIVTCCQLVAASVFLLSMTPGLTWVLLLIMFIAVFGSKLFFRQMRSLSSHIRTTDSRIQKHMQENLQHRVLALSLIGVDRVNHDLEVLHDDLNDSTVRRLNYSAVARTVLSFGFTAGYAAAFLWGVVGIKNGAVTYGMMTAFLQLVSQIQRPVAELGRHVPAFINALSSVERLMELEELPVEDKGDDLILEGAPGVSVNNMSFAYPDDGEIVLDNLSFDFKPGTTTIIKGRTGIGKSTLIRLLMGLLKPVSGSVELYSSDGLARVPASGQTMCNFMYVPQGNSLMSGTIRENLLLSDSKATEEDMARALHLAVADFVYDLPAGLDTVCSETAGLSEGQAQRVAIARVLLRKGGILVLDESTSALDSSTEQTLLTNLASYCKGVRTVIFVTHKDAASSYADAVLDLS